MAKVKEVFNAFQLLAAMPVQIKKSPSFETGTLWNTQNYFKFFHT